VLLDRSIGPFTSYLWGEPVFDRTRLERALGARATPPPVDTAYFARLLAFARAVNWSPRPFEDADSVPLLPQTRRNPACDI
jgi:hypothetical protein